MPGDSMRTSSTMPTILWFLARAPSATMRAAGESLDEAVETDGER